MILKRAAAAVTLVVGASIVMTAGGQSGDVLQARLKQLFPSATAFSPKGGEPPHFKAYAGPGTQNVIGFAFYTTEVAPLERGYGGPIVMLVGIDLKGLLTGVIVADH